MGNTEIYGYIIGGVILWAILLSLIIGGAVQTKKRIADDEKKIDLLARIAQKLGVDVDEINRILEKYNR